MNLPVKSTLAVLVFALFACVSAVAADSTQYERAHAAMKAYLEAPKADGSVKVSKQLRRWEWYWQGRLMPDGSFPTPKVYMDEVQKLRSRKPSEDMLSGKVWKELGPTAPDLPSLSASWNGIGRVSVIEFSRQNPSTFWAGAATGGLWKTTNSGTSWTYVDIPGLPVLGISDIAIAKSDERVMYIATGDVNASTPNNPLGFPNFSYGVIKSTDGGATWMPTGLTLDPSTQSLLSRLWVDPDNPNIVICAGYLGVRRSTDGGASWRQTAQGLFRDMIGHPTNKNILYATTFSESGGAEILRSTDGGESWSTTFSIPFANRIRLAVTKASANVVTAVASLAQNNGLEGVYKSVDAGVSFAQIPASQNLLHWNSSGQGTGGQGFYDLAMEVSPLNANHLFVGGVNVWRTTTNGQTWILSAHWTGEGAPWVHADQHYFKFHPTTNVLYATHDGGIARSTDQGISWRDISNGMRIQQYYHVSSSNTNPQLMLAGSQDNGTALSRNGGTSFIHTLDSDGMMSAIDFVNPSVMYGSYYNGTFFRSSNQGNNWVFSSSPGQRGESMAAWVSPIAADPVENNVAYIGYGQVYKTNNGGASWTRISQISTNVPSRWIAVAPSDNKHIYVAYNAAHHVTTNGGTNWQAGPAINGIIMSMDVHPTEPKRYYVAVGGFNNGYKVVEVNNGVATNITGTGLPNVPCNTVVYQRGTPNRLFAGTDLGVFVTDVGSGIWEPYGTGMPPTIVTAMRLLPSQNILRVSTYGRGLWEIDAKQCSATKPTITRTGNSTICSADSVILRVNQTYASYRWSTGDTSQQIVVKGPVGANSITVSVTDNAGCRASSDAVTITVQQAPSRPLISQRGADTLRSSAVGGITVFQWYRDGVVIPGATGREYVTAVSGSYTVEVKNSNGCTNMSNAFNFVFEGTSVLDVSERVFSANPNPAADNVTISLPDAPSRELQLLDLGGNVVFRALVADGAATFPVNLSGIARGVLIARLQAGSSIWMCRVVHE